MLVPGHLGFPGVVLVFFFFFSPIITFVIRWKWRIAVARKEEIMRLVAMASEEAARAELESAVEYSAVSIPMQFQCAVCYCPTTTRCSRCKAVRYCSGKCQIIHWRQGHKLECHPPSSTIQFNGTGSDSNQKAVLQGEQGVFCGNHLEIEGRWYPMPIETLPKESASSKSSFSSEFLRGKEDDKVEALVYAKGVDIISESSSTSTLAGLSASNLTNESLVDVSVREVPFLSTLKRSEGPLSDDIAPSDVNATELTKSPPSELTGSVASVNNFSCSSKLKQKTPSYSAGLVDCGSINSSASSINDSNECTISEPSTAPSEFWEGTLDTSVSGNDVYDDSAQSSFSEGGSDGILSESGTLPCYSFNLSQHAASSSHSPCLEPKTLVSDDEYLTNLGNKMPAHGAAVSEKMVTDASTVRTLPALSSERSVSVDNDQSKNSQLLKSKGIRSLLSSASDDHPSSITRGHSLKSSKVASVHTMLTGSSEIASFPPIASNGLRTSVRKVVQQFRVPKLSKHYSLGFGSEVAGKSNYKMLFPYELFIKLYKWEKVGLSPCGLTNCGNSCYANVVLQCLAFTRPLTAYLLQGLHSKACPKKEWCFTCEFEGLIRKASEGKSPLSPIGILSQIQSIGSHLGHGKEEDAHEFLRYAIDIMQSVCIKEARVNAVGPVAEETTLIGLIFGGYLRSKIKCMKCHGKSERHERMMDLTVEIQGDIGTLEEALGQFTATEILDGENKYQCSRCKSYQKAKKKLTVLEAPNILTIALKRFQSGKFGKINKLVRFPEILNLAPYMSGTSDKSHVYSLYAVVVHLDVMNAAFSGHYVCYVKNIHEKWFKIDDCRVKPVELDRVLSKGAYMLFYARCSPRPPSLIRNAMMSYDSKVKPNRSSEAVPSSHCRKNTTSRARPVSTVPSAGTSIATRRPEDYPYWMTGNSPSSFESFDSFNGRFHRMNRIPKVDSSSDNSSLFSCSDEGSCSTESTRDSTSTDDFSDYIFGEAGRSWNSPWRFSEDSDCSSSSPLFSRYSPLPVSDRYASGSPETSGYPTYIADPVVEADGIWTRLSRERSRREGLQEGIPQFLYSDTAKQFANLTNCRSSISSSRETDSERLGWGNPLDMKSGVSLRRSTSERKAHAFY